MGFLILILSTIAAIAMESTMRGAENWRLVGELLRAGSIEPRLVFKLMQLFFMLGLLLGGTIVF
jgi:hypothetical protein